MYTTVSGSVMVTEVTCFKAIPVSADAFRASKLALTTAAVRADPSWKVMPERSFSVQVVYVELGVMVSARYGLIEPSAATAVSGS